MDEIGVAVFALVAFFICLVLYLIPSIVAYRRRHTNTYAIVALNICLGWTLIGWIAALVWAFASPAKVQFVAPVTQPVTKPTDERPCPFCAESIKIAAIKCRFCGASL